MMHEWPACGRIGPMGHELAWRVHYADTDTGGVVYHANYLIIAERARGEMLQTAGYAPAPLSAANGRAFAVRACHIDFLAPARLGDILTIVSQIKTLGGASLEIAQKIRANGQDLVTILVRLVCIDGQFKPARVPEELRYALQRHPTLMMAAPTVSTGKDTA